MTFTADGALQQTYSTAHDAMLNAQIHIDELFGEGYAKKNPALIAAYMQMCAADFHTSIMNGAVDTPELRVTLEGLGNGQFSGTITDALNAIATALEGQQSIKGTKHEQE